MNRTGKNMIIGSLFLIFGISIILKAIFKIDIPVFRTFFACFLIFMGLKMLFSDFGWRVRSYKDDNFAAFEDAEFKHKANSKKSDYSIIFGNGKIDLSEVEEKNFIDINTIFGDVDVFINPKKIHNIKAESVFGDIRLPDGEKISFGTLKTKYPQRSGESQLDIRAHCVFGQIHFHEKNIEPSTNKQSSTTHSNEKSSEKK